MEKQRTHYSREFKINAVELCNQRGSMVVVAQELNITRDTLKRWKKEYNAGKYNADAVKTQKPGNGRIKTLTQRIV